MIGVDPIPDNEPAEGAYVHPGRARTSPLIWRLFGRDTSRPWDGTYRPDRIVASHPPPQTEPLSDDEKRVFVEWIDLGAHWDGIPEQGGPSAGETSKDQNGSKK